MLRLAGLAAVIALVCAPAAAAAGSSVEVVSPGGKVVARAAAAPFDFPADGSLVHVGRVVVTPSGVSLGDVRLLGGRITVEAVAVPASSRAASLSGAIVDGRPIRVTPNTLIPFGTLGYAIFDQTARTAGGATGRVALRLVLGSPVVGAPAGTQVLVGLPAPPGRDVALKRPDARHGSLPSPFLVLGFTSASAPVPGFLAAPALGGSSLGERAAALALGYLGVPYVWAGASPDAGFDCSGLVMYVYGQLGIHLTHYSGAQWNEGVRIPIAELQPGDLVFFYAGPRGPGHVGIYIGQGRFVHAPHAGDVVKISSLDEPGYRLAYVGAVRPQGPY